MDAHTLQNILNQLQQANIRLSHLIQYVLQQYHDLNNPLLRDLIEDTPSIASALYHFNEHSKVRLSRWAHNLKCQEYAQAIQQLVDEENGWRFGAAHTHPDQIRDFQLEDMITKMYQLAPEVCDMIQHILGSSDVPTDQQEPRDVESDSDDDLWEALGVDLSDVADAKGRRTSQKGFVRIKTAVIISIAMQSVDPQCNAFQSVMGVFLHACNTPDKVIKVLSRIGISISLTTIRRAIKSLSTQSYLDIEALGRTLLTSYAYDNFDVLLQTLIATIDGHDSERGLLHLTSGTLLRLEHGVTLEDLKCSRLLWNRSELNLEATDPRPFDPAATMKLLYTLHPEGTHQAEYRSWMFIQTLVKYGPTSFAHCARDLPDPKPVEAIPVVKLHQVPLRAMDINPATVGGNIDAIHNMYSQAGVGDPRESSKYSGEPFTNLEEFVTIIYGDLGTYERMSSALRRRSVERSPLDRLNSVIPAMGLFHFKMAAADAIWRLLVIPNGARSDDTSFMKIAGRLRPKESSRLVFNAKFRQQHELIQHVGAVLRLDAWQVEVKKRTGKTSLEEWAKSQPSLSEIREIADYLTQHYVEGYGVDLYKLELAAAARDEVRENTLRTHNYLLLYEELTYALNEGDIGRFETLLLEWIPLFRAAGKHKYAIRTLQFMHALYFIYPEGLRRAIRYNILVNPTGKPHAFRAVDWVVELLNLFIKSMYGGEGSGRTKDLILLESVLVLLYRSSHSNMERNLKLPGLTTSHAQKDMRATLTAALNAIIYPKKDSADGAQDTTTSPNDYKAKRKAHYQIGDAIAMGTETLMIEHSKRKRRAPVVSGEASGVAEGLQSGRDEGEVETAWGAEEEEEIEEDAEELSMDDLSTEGF